MKQDSEDESFGLKNRKKYEKLSKEQILHIKSMFANTGITVKQMQLEYHISYSVLNKIKKSSLNLKHKWKIRDVTKIFGSRKKELIKFIEEYALNAKSTITAKEVTVAIKKVLNASYSVSIIRKIMKNGVNLSFKKVKSRPRNIDLLKIKATRNLFAIKFSKIISEKLLLINIDESSINRSVKNAYSWGVKGYPIECQNSVISGSASMIMAICSNGAWITLVTNETINSGNFTWFLKILADWLHSHNYFGYNRAMLLLDNWSIHKSSSTVIVLQSFSFITLFIPAYSPEFAPVEQWFSIIKKNLSEICKREHANITIRQNYTKIYDSLISIKAITIKKMFKRFYRVIKEHL